MPRHPAEIEVTECGCRVGNSYIRTHEGFVYPGPSSAQRYPRAPIPFRSLFRWFLYANNLAPGDSLRVYLANPVLYCIIVGLIADWLAG